MSDLRDSLGETVLAGLCNTLSLSSALGQLGSNLWRSAGADGVAGAGQQLARGFAAASDVVCGREPRDPVADYGPPFTGGQCVGDSYDVSFEGGIIGSTPFSGTRTILGAVGIVQIIDPPPFPSQEEWYLTTDGVPVFLLQSGQTDINGEPQSFFEITNVARTDGQPDTCGNPPPQVPDYDPLDFSPTLPVNYDDSAGNPQTFNLPVVYGPGELNENGDFIVPVSLEFAPEVNVNANINLNTGDLSINGGFQSGPQEIPEEEDVPEGAVLVGVRVIFTQAEAEKTRATERLDNGSGETLWLPRLAAVRFEYEEVSGPGFGPTFSAQTLESVIWAERPAIGFDLGVNGDADFVVTKIVMPRARFFTGAGPA